jgi:lambda repressor-like predicted transcriptional regulator
MGTGRYAIDKDKVKRLALENGLSIAKMCEEAGITVSVIYQNKTHYPSSIKRIADVLGVSIMEIVKE